MYIDTKIDCYGNTIKVYAPRKARGSKTFRVKGTKAVSSHARKGSGARWLYS
jgi:hypothetical protein